MRLRKVLFVIVLGLLINSCEKEESITLRSPRLKSVELVTNLIHPRMGLISRQFVKEYKYGDRGQLVQIIEDGKVLEILYNGNKIEEIRSKGEDQSMISRDSFAYDQDGHLIKRIGISNGKRQINTIYSYNQDGLPNQLDYLSQGRST